MIFINYKYDDFPGADQDASDQPDADNQPVTVPLLVPAVDDQPNDDNRFNHSTQATTDLPDVGVQLHQQPPDPPDLEHGHWTAQEEQEGGEEEVQLLGYGQLLRGVLCTGTYNENHPIVQNLIFIMYVSKIHQF